MDANLFDPNIYAKIYPHIVTACDEMERLGTKLTEESINRMTDRIYNNVTNMHPEVARYALKAETQSLAHNDYSTQFAGGLLFNLIAIGLISEFFFRRRHIRRRIRRGIRRRF